MENENIIVVLYVPQKFVRPIRINRHQRINSFNKSFPNEEKKTFVFNGRQLRPAQSLDFYHINDRDVVFALDKSDMLNNLRFGINAFKRYDNIMEAIQAFDRPPSKIGFRLRDIQLTNIEQKLKIFRKICTSVEDPFYLNGRTSAQRTKIDTKMIPNSPSETPLPICWNKHSDEGIFE